MRLMWLLFAFSGPVLWAASTHIDKYLVDRYFKDSDTAVLIVFTALIGIAMLPFIWFFRPGVLALSGTNIAVMVASGVLFMGAMLFYLRAIQSEEASVVAPLFQTSVLFTFLLAYLLLGETLTASKAAGLVLIVAATLVLSFDPSLSLRRFKLRLVLLMLACTFTLALASVIFKFYAVQDEFWATTFWMFAGEALYGVVFLSIPSYRAQFIHLLRSNGKALLAINASNELINLGGALANRYALIF
ncbi:MAG TPA: EamA family transporter, partial [Rhizomicrobium sp.]